MQRLLRPYGVIIDGVLELGLEVILDGPGVAEVRPHTGVPDEYVLSPAFVNAHSHLEYRGLQGRLTESDYWPWIREITLAKQEQLLDEVREDCEIAARENRRTGVAVVAEHSDRPFSGSAMLGASLKGVLFQEVITRFESNGPDTRLQRAESSRKSQPSSILSFLSPHAYQTVDETTLRAFGSSGKPISIHVAESDLENELTLDGTGAIADTLRGLGVPVQPSGKRLVETLDDLGLVRPAAQFVHCCAISSADIGLLTINDVSVAHCPRSNEHLNCPIAPVREMLDSGIKVGLGLDSAASSGPIDMFAELRAAVDSSIRLGRPITPEEAWDMATAMGADSLRFAIPDLPKWQIESGSHVPLIAIHVDAAHTTRELIERGEPDMIEWIELD